MSKAYKYMDNTSLDKAVNLVALELEMGTDLEIAIDRSSKIHKVSKRKLSNAFERTKES